MASSRKLLDDLDHAFEMADQKQAMLSDRLSKSAEAITAAETHLAHVRAEHEALIAEADAAYRDAQTTLDQLRDQLNDRIASHGTARPRVTVR